MMHMNPNEAMHDAADSNILEAGLLITTTTTTFSGGRYGRLRPYLLAGLFISCKPNSRRSFSSPYDPVLQLAPPAASEPLLDRNSSYLSESEHVIPIRSDNEEDSREEEGDHQLLLDSIGDIVKERDLHKLQKFGGFETVALVLESDLENGLAKDPNPQAWSIPGATCTKDFFFFFMKACNDVTIFLLLISAALAFTIEIMERGYQDGWHDGAAILFSVLMLVAVPAVVNFLHAKKLEKKLMEKNRLDVDVVRRGQRKSITVSDLLVGDIVVLKRLDPVPADGLYIKGEGLEVDEQNFSRTDCGRNPFLFYGSRVTEGSGYMLVTSVGADTVLGKILKSVTHRPDQKTLLEARIAKAKAYMDNLALSVSVLIAFVLFIKIVCRKHENKDDNVLPELKGNVSVASLLKMFERPVGRIRSLATVLTVVVIGIQHGMPMVITMTLYWWKEKVVSYQAEPRNPSALGVMGLVTVICIDITRELTCSQVEVDRMWIGETDVINDAEVGLNQVVVEALRRGIGASASLPEIYMNPAVNGSLVSFAKSRWDANAENLDDNFTIVDCRKLGPTIRGTGVIMRREDGEINQLHWEGCATAILGMCSHYYDCSGSIHLMEDQKDIFQQVIKEMEDNGLRPYALACKQVEGQEITGDGLNLLALLGLKYSCRLEVTLIIESLKDVGIHIILVSEDELSSVRAMAHKLGIFCRGTNEMLMGGDEFRETVGEIDILEKVKILGGCLPEDKLLLVNKLKGNGHVVAFVGGSTRTDVAALKEADVGIIKNSQTTANSRECSDTIISRIYSLPPAVNFGRCVYKNVQKFIQLQLTTCISGLLVSLIAAMFLDDLPLTAFQLIWVSIIVCLFGFPMMTMNVESRKLMSKPPGKRARPLVTQTIWKRILIQVLYQNLVLLMFLFKGHALLEMKKDAEKSMVFTAFTLCQIFNQLNIMNLAKKEVFKDLICHLGLLFSLGALLVAQVIVVEYGTSLAGFPKLNILQWTLCFLTAALPLGLSIASRISLVVSRSNRPPQSNSSYTGILMSSRAFASYLTLSFSAIIVYSLSQYFIPEPMTLR